MRRATSRDFFGRGQHERPSRARCHPAWRQNHARRRSHFGGAGLHGTGQAGRCRRRFHPLPSMQREVSDPAKWQYPQTPWKASGIRPGPHCVRRQADFLDLTGIRGYDTFATKNSNYWYFLFWLSLTSEFATSCKSSIWTYLSALATVPPLARVSERHGREAPK